MKKKVDIFAFVCYNLNCGAWEKEKVVGLEAPGRAEKLIPAGEKGIMRHHE